MASTRILPALLTLALVLTACGEGGTTAPFEPESALMIPASHIYLMRDGKQPGELVSQVMAVMQELRAGKPFAEVARTRTESEHTVTTGGFLGFMGPHTPRELVPALQATVVGHVSGPIDLEDGVYFLLRHSFEEGRRLEEALTIPAYGFFVGWGGPKAPAATREEAREIATAARQRVLDGEDLAKVALETVGPHPRRADYHIANLTEFGQQVDAYKALAKVKPGELGELVELEDVFVVLRRGTYFRTFARQIVIPHAEGGSASEIRKTTRSREEAQKLAASVLTRVKPDGSNWAEMVAAHTEFPKAIPSQGSMGAVTNGQLPADLEALLLETAPGQVGARLAESDQGFHILYRVN